MSLWGSGQRSGVSDQPASEPTLLSSPAHRPSPLAHRHDSDSIDPYRFTRRTVTPVAFGAQSPIHVEQPPRVIVAAGPMPADPGALAAAVRAARPQLKDTPLEGLLVGAASADALGLAFDLAARLEGAIERLVVDLAPGVALPGARPQPGAPLAFLHAFAGGDGAALTTFGCGCSALGALPIVALAAGDVAPLADRLRAIPEFIVTLASTRLRDAAHAVGAWRALAEALRAAGITAPLWIRNTAATAVHHEPAFLSRLLEASFLSGALLCDGLGDLVSVETETDLVRATRLAYNVLQGAGARISKTEFVACPSCGRTLFDLQSTTQRIRAQTGHLKGVKIAIMGCIVNGPGEMADADFGYVGGMPGRINLYVGKECVQYNIPAEVADQKLIELIRSHGKWIDPDPAATAAPTA
ncbi:MAG: flavodoxin-dependent (E)-4-hydroxy-3-methylbut-2-enyl-diphosphate synthase [Opitutaceae bacterium]|nr:flavodoxin-dependent (E)-4-hydroxy-3-methylbut-2-enyl-diphosphate synthase [Opitutaceae bacterium]